LALGKVPHVRSRNASLEILRQQVLYSVIETGSL